MAPRGVEPRTPRRERGILPLDYEANYNLVFVMASRRIELRTTPRKGVVLPLDYEA